MKNKILATVLGSFLALSLFAQEKKTTSNRAQDQDHCLVVNDGGSLTDALCAVGTTADTSVKKILKVGANDTVQMREDGNSEGEILTKNASGNTTFLMTHSGNDGSIIVSDSSGTQQAKINSNGASFLNGGTTELAVRTDSNCGTSGNVCSGTYTPTCSANSNVDSCVCGTGQFMRVGNVVNVSVKCDADLTSASTESRYNISLPIASDFASTDNATGSCNRQDGGSLGATACLLFARPSGGFADTMEAVLNTSTTNSTAHMNHFTYRVL